MLHWAVCPSFTRGLLVKYCFMNICLGYSAEPWLHQSDLSAPNFPPISEAPVTFTSSSRLSLCFDPRSVCRWCSPDGDTFVFMLIFSFTNRGAFVNAQVYIEGNDDIIYLWLRKLPCFWRASWDRLSLCHELFGCYVSSELWSSSLLACDISSGGSSSLQSGVLPSPSAAAAAGRCFIWAHTDDSWELRKRKFCLEHFCWEKSWVKKYLKL